MLLGVNYAGYSRYWSSCESNRYCKVHPTSKVTVEEPHRPKDIRELKQTTTAT